MISMLYPGVYPMRSCTFGRAGNSDIIKIFFGNTPLYYGISRGASF